MKINRMGLDHDHSFALTLTPSRALAIFRSQDGAPGHGHKTEALPWWFFGVLGGLLTVWLWPHLPFRPADLAEYASWCDETETAARLSHPDAAWLAHVMGASGAWAVRDEAGGLIDDSIVQFGLKS